MQKLAQKLLSVQKKLGAVSKDQDNPYFKSKYADINKFIEVVKPILNEEGVVLLQPLSTTDDGKPSIRTLLIDAESGELLEGNTPLVYKEDDPQKMGSAITYYRRYALQSMLFIEAQDDDANAASGKKVKATYQPKDDLPF